MRQAFFSRDNYIPQGYTLLGGLPEGVTVYAGQSKSQTSPFGAIAFIGKQSKPAWNYIFRTEAQRQEEIDHLIAGVQARAQMKAEIKAKRSQPNALKVGDILDYSWGYDQTNWEYFEVIAVKGQNVIIRELNQDTTGNGLEMQGICTPRLGDYCGEPMTKRVQDGNRVSMAHGSADLWNGKPNHYTSYA